MSQKRKRSPKQPIAYRKGGRKATTNTTPARSRRSGIGPRPAATSVTPPSDTPTVRGAQRAKSAPVIHVAPIQVNPRVASAMYGVTPDWLRKNPDLATARRKINNKTILYNVAALDKYFGSF